MKFKTIDKHYQESACGQYRVSFCTDPNNDAYFRLWHSGEMLADRRVPNFREDRQIAVSELQDLAKQHGGKK